MEIPTFAAPATVLPNLSLTDTVKNASSQVGGIPIQMVSAPNLGGATSALGGIGGGLGGATSALGGIGGGLGGATSALGGIGGGLGGATSALGGIGGGLGGATSALGGIGGGLGGATSALGGMELPSGDIGSVQDKLEKLTGPERAKFMSSLPELPEQGKGLKGIMEKGIDLGKFQENSVGNLMSKVSDFSPGKSILSLGKESELAAGLKGKLGALKPSGALGNALSGAIGGAGLGAIAGAISGGGKNLLANAAKGAGLGAIAGGVTGAVSNIAGGITGKIGSALGGGGVGSTIASGLTGAVGGAALGNLLGGQSVNLKGIAGNLAGSVAGGIGANIGSSLVGSNVTGMTGIGAAAGGAISGIVGGSAGKKALTGLVAGIGISAVSGVVTNKINNTMGMNTGTSGQLSQPNTDAPQTIGGNAPIDISKSSTKEVLELANNSPQSVPLPEPISSPDTAVLAPNQKAEEIYLSTGVSPSNAIDEIRQLDARYKANEITASYISTDILSRKLFMYEMNTFIQKRYSGFFKAKDSMEMRALMQKDIGKVSDGDKALVKSVIASYKGAFSLAYSGATDKVISDPENRILSLNDYLAMDTEDFYKFLTNVAEGQFEVKALTASLTSSKPPYKVFISKKSDSEVNITISSPAYGAGTATIPRAVPPPVDVLFNMKAIKECVSIYHFGKVYPNIVANGGTMDALDPKDGAYFRMWAMTATNGKIANMRYCCGNNIIIDQQASEETRDTGDEKKYNVRDLKDTPPEVSWEWPGWVAKVKIEKDLYYTISYNPYTIQVNSIQVVKMIPKT